MMVEAAVQTPYVLAIAEPLGPPEKESPLSRPPDSGPKRVWSISSERENSGRDFLAAAIGLTDSSNNAGGIQQTMAEPPKLDLTASDLRVRFKSNQETGRVAISVINAKTDEVIREIPSEEILRIQQKLKENLGVILDKNA